MDLVTVMVYRAKLQIQGMENIADLQFLKKLMRIFLFAMSTLIIKIHELECGFNRKRPVSFINLERKNLSFILPQEWVHSIQGS